MTTLQALLQRMRVPSAAVVLLLIGGPRQIEAQLARQTFEVNLGSGAIPGPLPFDEPFFLSAAAPENLLQVRLWAVPERELERNQCPLVTPETASTSSRARAPSAPQAPATPTATPSQPGAPAQTQPSGSPAQTQVSGAPAQTQPSGAPVQTQPLSTRKAQSIPMELTSSWSRAGLDSLTRFELEAGPLRPNRDYTFCFHLLRRPSAADSTAFSARATRNIIVALEANATGVLDSNKMLDTLQAALIRALPSADSIEFLDETSIFTVPKGETETAKLQRLDRLNVLASAYLRITLLLKAAVESEEQQVRSAELALHAVFRNGALPQLAAVFNASVPATLDRNRLRAAALLAATISQFDQNDAALIAGGAFPLDGSPVPGTTRNVARAKQSRELRAYLDNLTRTQTLLRDITTLATLARERPGAQTGTPSRAALDALISDLGAALTEISGEMQDLVRISDLLDERAAGVQTLVTSVRTLDFARIALRSTTSDTYKARANMYIGLDAGVLGAWDVRRIVPYFGANLYFRPVNKNAPLAGCWPCLGRRVSLTLGVTAISIAEKDRIEDTFNGHSILTGVGARLTDYWRVSGGLLIVRTYDEDEPGELRLGAVPSLATSLDIDIVGLLGKVGSFLLP
jgi:hypothetical protein